MIRPNVNSIGDPSFRERFLARTIQSGPDGSWRWIGFSENRTWDEAYRRATGCVRVDGRIHTAAKVAWMLEHGEVPEGMRVLIACGDRACVNPAHLMLDTVRKSVLI